MSFIYYGFEVMPMIRGKFVLFSLVVLTFNSCGPKIEASQAVGQLAQRMCQRMGECATGSAFGMDICVSGLTEAYTAVMKMKKLESVPAQRHEDCLKAVGSLACSHAQMSYWTDECAYMKNGQ